MEELYSIIKDFLKTVMNTALLDAEEEDTPLPILSDKTIIFGQVDRATNTNKVVCAILPETQENGEGTISDLKTLSKFVVTFICRNSAYDVLVRQMCRYSEIFRKCVESDYTLNSDVVENAEIGTRTFHSDVGNDLKQITAVELELTLTTADDIGD